MYTNLQLVAEKMRDQGTWRVSRRGGTNVLDDLPVSSGFSCSRVFPRRALAQSAIVCRWASYLSAAEFSENKDGHAHREASEKGEWALSGWGLQTRRLPVAECRSAHNDV